MVLRRLRQWRETVDGVLEGPAIRAEEVDGKDRVTLPSVDTEDDLPDNQPEPSVAWVEDCQRWYIFVEE